MNFKKIFTFICGTEEMKSKKNILVAIFVLTMLLWGCYAFYFGVVMSPDSHVYDSCSDVLISHNFNIFSYLKSVQFSPLSYLYLGFVNLVALTKVIAGTFWPQLIVIINVILGALLAVMLADLVYIFTRSKLSVWIVFILYAFNPEIILWPRYVLSDISYMFLNFLTFYFIAKAFLEKDGHRGRVWTIILFVFLASIFYRPTAIVMIPVILFAFYLYNRKKDMRWKPLFVFLASFIAISMLIHAVVIKNIWSLHPGKSALRDFVVFLYQKGIVIHDRPHTYHYAPTALLDYVFITADKFIHYFYFSDRLFSSIHKLSNYFFFMPLYALFILGIFTVAKERNDSIIKSLVALSVIVIVAYSLFHSVTLIDYDWRYRLPVLPYMLFISGLGVKFLIQTYKGKDDAGV